RTRRSDAIALFRARSVPRLILASRRISKPGGGGRGAPRGHKGWISTQKQRTRRLGKFESRFVDLLVRHRLMQTVSLFPPQGADNVIPFAQVASEAYRGESPSCSSKTAPKSSCSVLATSELGEKAFFSSSNRFKEI